MRLASSNDSFSGQGMVTAVKRFKHLNVSLWTDWDGYEAVIKPGV
jgi:hypothetical protein